MKIQCNVCAAAEASVFCCADEAALCWSCDQNVHAANKLAGKHQRVRLSSSSTQMPKCDVCQETAGYFFCVEDRALLCRKCDVAIHASNSLASVHKRFLLTGVKVDLEATEPRKTSSLEKTSTTDCKTSEFEHPPLSKRTNCQASVCGGNNNNHSSSSLKPPPLAGGSSSGSVPQWQLDEFIGLGDFTAQGYNFTDVASSKQAHNGKLGVSDCFEILRAGGDGELEGDENLGQVPSATFWAVPEIPSLLPTSSALYSPKNYQNALDSSVFVPDIGYHNNQSHIASSKRRRNF
ncbi:hypothetical protein ABFS83_08G193400 [Erythranthe nasuta]